MIVAVVAFEARAPGYQNVPGLLRKHYLVAPDGVDPTSITTR